MIFTVCLSDFCLMVNSMDRVLYILFCIFLTAVIVSGLYCLTAAAFGFTFLSEVRGNICLISVICILIGAYISNTPDKHGGR